MLPDHDMVQVHATERPPIFSRLDVKIALMGAVCVLLTALALVLLAVRQSGQYNALAQREVDQLIAADLDHITQGVYNLVRTENEAVQLQVDYNLNVARHLLDGLGPVALGGDAVDWTVVNQFTQTSRTVRLPRFSVGGVVVGQNADPAIPSPLVDEVTRLVGETATLFQRINEAGDMLRVATTIRTEGGARAIGTYIPAVNPDGIPNPVISTVLRGETYHGRAYVVDAWYLTAYAPVFDRSDRLVGMIYVGIKQAVVEGRIRQAILQTQVGKTGYVYVLGGAGKDRGRYIISDKGLRDGEDIWLNQDSDGHFVIQDIIGRATALSPGAMTTVRYRWQNPGEIEPRWKIARIAYYAPWDWVIGTSVYEDELTTYSDLLREGRRRMIRFMGLAGVMITCLVGLIGIGIAWSITRSVRQMTVAAEKIIGGDLSQTVSVTSRDEIGVLAQTFNLMIDQLNRSMEHLRQSEEKYRGMIENAFEGLFQNGMDGRILSANPALAVILGYDSPDDLIAEVTNVKTQLYVNPADRDLLIDTAMRRGKATMFEVPLLRRDGEKIWTSINARMVYDAAGNPFCLEGFLADITDRKRAEEALAESRNYLDEIINAVADPLFVKDHLHRWVLVNNALCAFVGYDREGILGKTDYDYFPKAEADIFRINDQRVLDTGEANINEETLTDARGQVHTIVTKKTLYTDKTGERFIVGIIRDITEQKRAEEERKRLESRLTQAQKMEAIGNLAGGIAHDFNNILSAIIGFTELSLLETAPDDAVADKLRQVLKAGNRARELVRQILTFSRMTETSYAPLSLKIAIKEFLKMLRSMIPTTVAIESHLAVQGLVMSDPTQIHQILMNLCTNAVHAMEGQGGTLTVTLDEVLVKQPEKAPDPGLRPGAYVIVSIEDTGRGIPSTLMDKIFEPFFTTKEQGRGTGLGLSVIHGIVKNHQGAIICHSVEGKGTTFSVYLPKLETALPEITAPDPVRLLSGHERILFVDDEVILVNLVQDMLISVGYDVVGLTSSAEALDLFRRDPSAFDLVITDMTMPGLTGDRLAGDMLALRPDLPVILCTGYHEHMTGERARSLGIREFIMKPVDMKTLTEAIRRVLDTQTSEPH
jgi:PAS domain S-box-containing protein